MEGFLRALAPELDFSVRLPEPNLAFTHRCDHLLRRIRVNEAP
jgi:hypothetical protein